MRKDEGSGYWAQINKRPLVHAAFHMAVSEELRRADAQHPDAADLYEMLAILGEEYGELQKAALQFDYEGGSYDAMLKECIQVGAMALKTFRHIHEQVMIPRLPPPCPSCGRTKEERGRHEPLPGASGYLGDRITEEPPWCSDAFHD